MENEKKLEIAFYEPPMCCAGGLCGPSVDQDLLDLKEIILKINEKFANIPFLMLPLMDTEIKGVSMLRRAASILWEQERNDVEKIVD